MTQLTSIQLELKLSLNKILFFPCYLSLETLQLPLQVCDQEGGEWWWKYLTLEEKGRRVCMCACVNVGMCL